MEGGNTRRNRHDHLGVVPTPCVEPREVIQRLPQVLVDLRLGMEKRGEEEEGERGLSRCLGSKGGRKKRKRGGLQETARRAASRAAWAQTRIPLGVAPTRRAARRAPSGGRDGRLAG